MVNLIENEVDKIFCLQARRANHIPRNYGPRGGQEEEYWRQNSWFLLLVNQDRLLLVSFFFQIPCTRETGLIVPVFSFFC